MTAAIARIFPRASAASVANIDRFVTVALFSCVGLLLSLSVLLLDQYIPGEWFLFDSVGSGNREPKIVPGQHREGDLPTQKQDRVCWYL